LEASSVPSPSLLLPSSVRHGDSDLPEFNSPRDVLPAISIPIQSSFRRLLIFLFFFFFSSKNNVHGEVPSVRAKL
jgi:hypothetical protein